MHANFAHTDVHQKVSFRHCLDEEYLVVEEAVDSELKAVMHVPVVRISVHAEEMCLAVADLVCISGHPDAMVPLALLCNVRIPAWNHR